MMLSYSLKRLLLSIPVLWLLVTVVFLLSRTLPGTYGSESLYIDGVGYNKSTQQQRDQAYQEYLHNTGQDLPIFYFSLDTQANSGKDNKKVNSFGKLAQRLSWRYGDQDKALAYYKNIDDVAIVLKNEQKVDLLPYVYRLHNTLHPDTILHYTNALIFKLPVGQARTVAVELHQSAVQLVQTKNQLNYLIPEIQWHGLGNQYHKWLLSLVEGDLGKSFRDSRPVAAILWEAFSNTFWLILISMILTFILALELSIIMVQKTKINWHKILLPILYILDSIPLFVLCLLLLILFATPEFLQLFPVFGLGYNSFQPDNWYEQMLITGPYLVLPIICLVLANLPYLTNQIFHSLSDTMQAGFIRTARSKGLKESNIIRKHALRNALLPVITVISDFLPALVAGSVIIETIFAIPGIGRLLISSVISRDFPVILGIILLVALVKMGSHFIADICYAKADPRVQKATTA